MLPRASHAARRIDRIDRRKQQRARSAAGQMLRSLVLIAALRRTRAARPVALLAAAAAASELPPALRRTHAARPNATASELPPAPIGGNASNCTLTRFPKATAEKVHFFSFVAADLYHMLAHALRYYTHLGLDLRQRGRVVVHNASGPANLERTATYLRRYGVSYVVSNVYSSAIKRGAANAYLRSLPTDAWLVYPDLDEFFAFPCALDEIMSRGAFISGIMVDRVAHDWRLAALRTLPRESLVTNRHGAESLVMNTSSAERLVT